VNHPRFRLVAEHAESDRQLGRIFRGGGELDRNLLVLRVTRGDFRRHCIFRVFADTQLELLQRLLRCVINGVELLCLNRFEITSDVRHGARRTGPHC